ncbi:facilitated trehalose transporter Tret1-like isoform X2 [Pieris napi]|uniref:facilitated trehalose transporter Tret1-like isoform X2 n=1 Tax=Pieris napi TaxID=78633 RepID=UPI001FBB7A42|nr:facilitated trehalose transporter Tret1-like isoform X2 [Pieris napi]
MTDIDKSLISPFIKQCFVCATVCMNVLSNGCAYGFPAVLLPQLKLPDSPIPLTKAQESWIASVVTIAMLVGNFSMPAVMDRLGRKKAHFIVMIPTAIGWLLIVFATNVESLILARIMHGLSLGQVVLIRAVIIGEYTSPRNRGAFLTLISVAQSSGVFFVHLLGSLNRPAGSQTTGDITNARSISGGSEAMAKTRN